MSRTILTKVGGFTPLMDAVVQEVGMDAAAVFGVVWRYCQMEDGVCRASAVTISKRLGKERRFVFKYLKTLEEHGFIKDVSSQYLDAKFLVVDESGNDRVEGSVKVYADTGKAEIVGAIFTTDNYDFPEKDEGNFQIINNNNGGEYQKGTGGSAKSVLGGSTKKVLVTSTNNVLGGSTQEVPGEDSKSTGGSTQEGRGKYQSGTGSSTSKVLKDSTLRKNKDKKEEINKGINLFLDSDSKLDQANVFLKAAFTDIRNDNLIPAAEMSTWIYCLRAIFYDPAKSEITIGAFNETGLNVLLSRNYGIIIQNALRKIWNPNLIVNFANKPN